MRVKYLFAFHSSTVTQWVGSHVHDTPTGRQKQQFLSLNADPDPNSKFFLPYRPILYAQLTIHDVTITSCC